jgi:hypothetical protein
MHGTSVRARLACASFTPYFKVAPGTLYTTVRGSGQALCKETAAMTGRYLEDFAVGQTFGVAAASGVVPWIVAAYLRYHARKFARSAVSAFVPKSEEPCRSEMH